MTLNNNSNISDTCVRLFVVQEFVQADLQQQQAKAVSTQQ
jgi:hypothetical protein